MLFYSYVTITDPSIANGTSSHVIMLTPYNQVKEHPDSSADPRILRRRQGVLLYMYSMFLIQVTNKFKVGIVTSINKSLEIQSKVSYFHEIPYLIELLRITSFL